MSDAVVAVCPSCSQKYSVPRSNVGMRARCRSCGQIFKVLDEPPIDDETIFGWVTQDDPASQSVLGSTGLFGAPAKDATQVPAGNRWVHPAPPDRPRIKFEKLDETGAYFTFPPAMLRDEDLRCSFPHRCVQCLSRDDLEIHLLIWIEKVPGCDAALINESETRTHRILSREMEEHGLNWFKAIKPINTMPAPFHEPFAYCICPQCSVVGAVRCRVVSDGIGEICQIVIAHPGIALDFFRNNGGRNTPGYQKLLVAARQHRDNQWKSLAVGVRIKLSQWYTPRSDEKFLGYFADKDFDKADRGSAGLVLTDKRMVYHKYQALREYPLDLGGKLDIDASRQIANIEIKQTDRHDALLATTPLAASSLARTLTGLQKPWKIEISTHA